MKQINNSYFTQEECQVLSFSEPFENYAPSLQTFFDNTQNKLLNLCEDIMYTLYNDKIVKNKPNCRINKRNCCTKLL